MIIDNLDRITDAGALPAAPQKLHTLAVEHGLPFLIAAVPTPDSDDHVGLLVEVADGYSPRLVAAMIREVAAGLEGMNR